MLWSEVLSILDSSTMVILQENKRTGEYYSAELVGDQIRTFSDGVVYFAPLSRFSQYISTGRAMTNHLAVFLLMDQPLPAQIPPELDNVVGFRSRDDFLSAFSLLIDSFQQAFRLNNSLQDFLGLMAGSAGMDQIAQQISAVYRHSVGIYDTCFTIIGQSDLDGFRSYQSRDLLDDLEHGYVAPDLIRQVQSEQDGTYFTGVSARPVLVQHYRREFKHYSTPILAGATTAGFFSVFLRQEEDLTPVERLYLPKFARLISVALQRSDFHSANKTNFYTHFFAAMLSDQGDHARDWENRLRGFGYDLRESMHVVAARFSDSVYSRSELSQLVSTLHHLVPGSIYCVQYDLVILFCSNDPGTFSLAKAMEYGSTFFSQGGLKLGVSAEFHSLSEMRTYFEQAVAAIEVGSIFLPKERFCFYDDLRPYHMICRLAESNDVASFCYPPFLALLDYDHRKKSDLAQTLYYYLSDVKNPAAVCRRLQIHKNTLYFRLDKAREIMGVSFDKLNVASQIFLTVLILRFTRKISWDYYEPPQQRYLALLSGETAKQT